MSSPFKTGKIKTPGISKHPVESLLQRELTTTSEPSRNKIYASNAGLCERQSGTMMLLSDEFKNKMDAPSQFYFAIGNSFEDVVSRALKSSGEYLYREFYVDFPFDWLPIGGRIDFIITHPEDGDIWPVELKTCGKLPDSPKPSHYSQLMTYLILTGLDKGIIWYISRTPGNWKGILQQKVFEIEPTENEKIWVAERMVNGALFAEKNLIAPKAPKIKKYKCGFCPLIPYCWDGADFSDVIDGRKPNADELKEITEESKKKVKAILKNKKKLLKIFYRKLYGRLLGERSSTKESILELESMEKMDSGLKDWQVRKLDSLKEELNAINERLDIVKKLEPKDVMR